MKETRRTRINRAYELLEYDDEWPIQFEKLKIFLNDIFKGKAKSIEHIGSTSIPGMLAKPVIDALVVVDNLEGVKILY